MSKTSRHPPVHPSLSPRHKPPGQILAELVPWSVPPCPAPSGCKTLFGQGFWGMGRPLRRAQLTACPPLPSPHSAAGEFFPEAAQVAYQMWEHSALAKVKVSTPRPPLRPPSLCSPLPAFGTRPLLCAAGHGHPAPCLSLCAFSLRTPGSSVPWA